MAQTYKLSYYLRQMRLLALVLFCIQLLPAGAMGQSVTSPYKLSLAVDIPISTNAFALLGTSQLIGTTFQMPKKEVVQALNRDSVNRFDRWATYNKSRVCGYTSDALLYSSVAIPLFFLIDKNTRKDFGKIAAISAETFVLNLAITDLLKETVRRKRPLLYNPDVPVEKKMKKDNFKSFFSGHTSTVAAMSFSFANMYATYNPNSKLKPMVWTIGAVLPAVTALLRVKAGKHYWTDVIAGYAAGAIVGLAVPYLHSTALKINQR